jgi:CRP/FNR family transcriptional regulator
MHYPLHPLPALPECPTPISIGSHPDPFIRTDPLRDIVRLLGGDVDALTGDSLAFPVALRRLSADSTLAHEGDAAQCLHVLRSGSLKCFKTLEDGYEQVMSLVLPGDVLGFDALHSGRLPATVMALEVSTLYTLPLKGLPQWRRDHPALDQALQLALSRQLARAADLTEMLAAVSSGVRLARFLLHMSAQAAERGWSPRRLRLHLGRREIASLLGMAHETVSRSFTTLDEAGLVKVDNREIEILDPDGLKGLSRCTRGPVVHNGGAAAGTSPQAPRDRRMAVWCAPALSAAGAMS